QDVRARHEGASFDTDVFLVDRGVLPVETAVAAQVVATRFEPEILVPPMPGLQALRARGKDRDEAMYFDQMERRIPAGMSRDGEPVFLDLDFLDGSRGAHVNISGVSGVATKTTYALFLLYALFHSPVLGGYGANTKALVFNVKGEDLMWLDRPNARLGEAGRPDYDRLGLPAGPGVPARPRPRGHGRLRRLSREGLRPSLRDRAREPGGRALLVARPDGGRHGGRVPAPARCRPPADPALDLGTGRRTSRAP